MLTSTITDDAAMDPRATSISPMRLATSVTSPPESTSSGTTPGALMPLARQAPPIDDDCSDTVSAGLLHPQLQPAIVQQQRVSGVHRAGQGGVARRHAARTADGIANDDLELVTFA